LNVNNNLLAAVACKVTGKDIFRHHLCEISIIPLDFDLKYYPGYIPYSSVISCSIEDCDFDVITKKYHLEQIVPNGKPPSEAAEYLESWFDSLKLSPNKKLIPITHDWPFFSAFIKKWCGRHTFDYLFDWRFRDLISVASFLNDRSEFKAQEIIPYPKQDLTYIALSSEVKIDKSDTLSMANGIVDIYKKMVLSV